MDYGRSSSLSRSLRDGDFDESDFWDALKDQEDLSGPGPAGYVRIDPVNSISRRVPSAATMIPRLSSGGNYSNPKPRIFQNSAPVNLPDWSEISSKKNSKKGWEDSGSNAYGGSGGGDSYGDDGVATTHADDDVDDETGSSSIIPPHELIARRSARSDISSFSVFEGVGRTLKGRDLSKVRNAVLTKTGFLESP